MLIITKRISGTVLNFVEIIGSNKVIGVSC